MRRYVLAAMFSLVLAVGAAAVRADETAATRPTSGLATSQAKTRPAETQPTLAGAKSLYWKGRYAEAARAYKALASFPADAVPASIGLAESYDAIGKYDEALAALRAASAQGEIHADWQVTLAGALSRVGKYAQALAAGRKARALRGDWAPAILCLGRALEAVGKKKEAVEVYKGLDKAISAKGFQDDAVSLVAAGEVLDRYAILTGQKASQQAQNILHNYFQRAYQEVDKQHWPANLAAGIFLLSKYKWRQAGQEFALADKINPHLPDVCVGRGVILLQRYRFEQAIAQADKALKINPRHADGLLLKAASLMLWRKFDQAPAVIEKVLQVNPNHQAALSMLAAVHVRKLDEEKAAPFIERIHKVNPNHAEVYETIGDWLSAGRQFTLAEKYYTKARELAPELAGPVTGLGRLYMQTGREKLAKETLEKAFAIDDYRADVLNYLKLLDSLEKFQVRQTEHFIIKVDGKHDAVLLDWVAEVAEKVHAEVAKDFEHAPADKTLVELFPNHQQFSVRISGRGWIGTIGACTGRVIAMPAPDPLRGGFGQFNWAVVLRHEYTHTVTLSATENRIPHWFTEACAVWEQPDRRNFQAVALLVDAVRTGKLYPVKELSWGFIRPDPRRRGRGARSLAYAQSEWIFEYVVETKGYDAILQMLRGFREGLTQAQVFQKALAITEERFDKDFGAWARKQIGSWGFDADPLPTLAKASPAAKAKPDSADAQADLALALFQARRLSQAQTAAAKALKIDPKHRRALEVLGYAHLRRKRHDEAIQAAERLKQAHPSSALGAKILAECYLAKQRWLQAIAALEDFKLLRPLDPYGYEKLAKLYGQLGDAEKALPNLIELHRRTMKDPKYARQVAEIYRASATPEKALDFWEQVIQINPYDAGAYKAMASLYLAAKQYDRSLLAMRSVCLLEPKNADSWAQLAALYYRVGRAKGSTQELLEARSAAQKALGIDPNSPAKDVLERIEAELKKPQGVLEDSRAGWRGGSEPQAASHRLRRPAGGDRLLWTRLSREALP